MMLFPTNFTKVITPIALAISLAACGSSGSSFFEEKKSGVGTTTTTTTTTNPDGVVASSISVLTSSRQLFSGGPESITISVVAKDANNVILNGAKVNFSVNNNANLKINSSSVEGGIHIAELTPGTPENRSLAVIVSSGSVSETIIIDVIGTKLKIDGPSSIAINKETKYTIKLQDSADKAITHEDVIVTSALGNAITPLTGTSFTTDSNGELAINLKGVADGTDTITATALGASTTQGVVISGDDFTLNSTNSDVNLGSNEVINLIWLKNNTPQAGKAISIRTTRGVLSTSAVTTDANGRASFTVSSDTAGTATITAESDGGLTSTLKREYVATAPAYLNTQAAPTLIAPNKSSTIITKVRDANDNPVKNVKINFNLSDTVNGELSDSQAVTDSLGRAEVVYTAGNSSSGLEGVTINTKLQDFASITDLTYLTVGGNALRIVLGDDELTAEDSVFYKKTFGVIVTDSGGNPVPNQEVDFTISVQSYLKGEMEGKDTSTPPDGKANIWGRNITAICPVEDLDRDGNLDAGEDTNNNGTLEPTQDATITTMGKTDSEGKMTVFVIYPQSHALWSTQLITAKTIVNGTEFVENTIFNMNILLADVKSMEKMPPNFLSPYGQMPACDVPN